MTPRTEPRYWNELTSPEIGRAQQAGDVVLLPVGSIEQHGAHLPVDTDINGAWETAKEVGRRRDYALVAPPVWWGLSAAHRKFPGVLTLRSSTFSALLTDLCDSILDQGFEKIALIVGHASNKPAVSALVAEIAERHGAKLVQINYLNLGNHVFREHRKSAPGGDAHAGELESSVQLHLRPGLVDPEAVRSAPVHLVDPKRDFGLSDAMQDILVPGQVVVGFDLKASFPDGIMGDPTVATAELGALVFEAVVDKACSILDEYHEL